MEKRWIIKEVLPIKCTTQKNRFDDWEIIIPSMTMTYDTFMSILSKVTHMETYGISYNYNDGKATLNATQKGLEEIKQMKNLIIFD